MPAASVLDLLGTLDRHGVDAVVGGGWGVDALLHEQTREHQDLDLWLPANQLDRLIVGLAGRGIDRVLPYGGDRPWNFVLHDGASLRIDLHMFEAQPDGSIHYGSVQDGVGFPAEALAGDGRIAGVAVRCEAPQWSLRWHIGYPVRAADRHDVPLLCARFGLDLPAEFR